MKQSGITYLRTTREVTPILYTPEEQFPIGGSKTHWGKVSKAEYHDGVLIISAGITLYEALTAQQKAQEQGKSVVVVDAYSVKPIDTETISQLARLSKQVVVVEDHYPEGGLGEAVSSLLTVSKIIVDFCHLAVRQKPRSGTKDELLAYEEINATEILKLING
jgi:transketolase